MHTIDLRGPLGNAFALAGLALEWQRQLGVPRRERVGITSNADSYNDVLDNFDALFKGKINYEFLHDPRNEDDDDYDEEDDDEGQV